MSAPAPALLAPPSFDRAFILLEEEVRELLSSTAALDADIERIESAVADAERRRADAATRRKDAETARELHVAELNEAQEELRAGTWQPAADAEPLPTATASAPVSGATASAALGTMTTSEAPSARGGAATGSDAPGAAAGGGGAAAAPAVAPPQPLTQRLVNERCRDVLRLLRDISEASRSMPDRDEDFTALLRESYKGLLTALKAAIPPSSSNPGAAARGQGRSQAGGGAGTAGATGGGAARAEAPLVDAGTQLGNGNSGVTSAALNREPLQRAVAAKRLYQQQQQQQQQQQARAVRSRSESPPPGPGTALYSGLPPLRVAPGGQAATPSAEAQPGGGGAGGRSWATATERLGSQRQPHAAVGQASGSGRAAGSGSGAAAGARRGSGREPDARGGATRQLYEAARGPAGTAMAQSLLQPLLQPELEAAAAADGVGGHEEEADWDWHWQESQAEAPGGVGG